MNMRRILTGTIALGIAANAMDWLLMKFFWGDTWTAMAWANPTPPMTWLVVGDFAGAFMLMWAWDKFGATEGKGAGAGFRFGLFAGAFVNFPAALFWQMYIKDFPYMLAWKLMVVGILSYGVLGALAAALDGMKKEG